MTLEPKTVEPGYLGRWTREACSQWATNFPLWFATMLATSLLATALGQSLVTSLTLLVVAYFTVHVSFEFAVTSEHGRVRVAQLPPMLGASADAMADELWRNRRIFFISYTLGFAFVGWVALHKPATPAEPPAAVVIGVIDWLFSMRSPLLPAAAMLLIGYQGIRYNNTLGYLNYPLRRMFRLSHEEARMLLEQASRKNIGATFALEILVGGAALLCIGAAPGLAPFLFCFLSAFCYAACRDMFGPGAALHQGAGAHAEPMTAQGAA